MIQITKDSDCKQRYLKQVIAGLLIVTGAFTQIVFPYFIYYYFMNGNMNKEFGAYAEGADYMTYVKGF